MTKLNPYLTFPGTAAQAIELYKKVFKIHPMEISKFKDMPPQEGVKFSGAGGERIVHTAFQVGNDMLMISDAPEGQDSTVVIGTQTHVSLHPDSREEADRVFGLLSSDGGMVVMPMADAFWGDYFGMCKDKFGVSWMINFHPEKK